MTEKRKIDWERMRNDLEVARARITQRIRQGSMNDLRERLAADLGSGDAERLLPREIDNVYSDYQLSLCLSKDSRLIYAYLPNISLFYEMRLKDYDDLESSLPQVAGRLFSDIRERLTREAEVERLRKGRQFISAQDNIILPFSFDTSKYQLIGESK